MAQETREKSARAARAAEKLANRMEKEHKPSVLGLVLKYSLLLVFDTAAFFVAQLLIAQQQWVYAWGVIIVTLIMNWIYIRRGGLPAKYLAPGVLFLIFFSFSVVIYSGYIAFTNYGGFHNGSKDESIRSIELGAMVTDTNAPYMGVQLVEDKDKKIYFLATDNVSETDADGNPIPHFYFGGQDWEAKPFQELTPDVVKTLTLGTDMMGFPLATEIPGYTSLNADQVTQLGATLSTLKIPLGPDLKKDGWMALDPSAAGAQRTFFDAIYDKKTDTFTRQSDGKLFPANNTTGFFQAEDGERLSDTGWQVFVGMKNFNTIFGNEKLRAPLAKIFTWTVVFAVASVVSTFILGLALALLFNDERMKGKKIYRSIMILPYAFPGFLSAYVWKGMFSQDYGFINHNILGCTPGAGSVASTCIPWLSEEGPAKWAVLLCNLWLGFPYMFLITTGALQAIPGELTESATIDGATGWQQLRLIKLPLLLISLAPLLISSFAYNFNNFTIIYLITGGGPSGDPSLGVDVGGTDILISFVYKIAFQSNQGADYGLASAFSILIFFIVGGLSMIGFRRTKFLEEVTE
jgi:arabinogalactan oligomer/maltooligosaccharide transport system permease protein